MPNLTVTGVTADKQQKAGVMKNKKNFLDCETDLNANMHVRAVPLRPPCWRVGRRGGRGRPHPLASFLSLSAALIRGTEADTVPGGP